MSQSAYDKVQVGEVIHGKPLAVTEQYIHEFAEASHDFNALHLDEKFMGSTAFGKTQFEGVIVHGLANFSTITRMLTDWLWPQGAIHRRLETRHLKPVYPGDTITPSATVLQKNRTGKGNWVVLKIELRNQDDVLIVSGESLAEYPH